MSTVAFMRMCCPNHGRSTPSFSFSFTRRIVKLALQSNLKCCPSLQLPCSSYFSWPTHSIRNASSSATAATSTSTKTSPLSELEEVMMGYVFGKKKATEVAHSSVVRKGDVVIDATCGNGHDTLALLNLVADRTCSGGHVYAMDIQKVALESTSLLLDQSLSPDERKHVELFLMCHSKMEEVVPSGVPVRLVAFNLGYLPGGEKAVVTKSETTLLALEAAKRILATGGLISIVVYVGHPGGREEFEMVQGFASKLPVENWVCCKLQMLNRPLAPVIVLLFRR